jgi:ABC-2 type transport system permease protein
MEYKGKKVSVNLLKNIRGNSGDENLNISIIELEYEITDAVRRLVNIAVDKIAFLEGHDELSEAATYDISKSLSRYFQIDRGRIGNDAAILHPYKVVIVAKPQLPFSEKEKLIIDQYIMNGGKVLWLIDGVRVAEENLSVTGTSPAIPLDLNLSDQLFRYGIRINPVILQDVQCAQMPVNVAKPGEAPHFEPVPWFFAPLLLTSYAHPVTRNIAPVRSEFCSDLDLVGENKNVSAVLLLATSDNTHIIGTPANIDLREMPSTNDKNYFNTGYVPVGALLEGNFESVFTNRMLPDSVVNISSIRPVSVKTKQIFVADGDVIKNEISTAPGDSTALPLGFDRLTGMQYGNRDFIENAVLYLADDEGWMQLKNKTFKLRLLNKQVVYNQKVKWQLVNVLLPLVILAIFGLIFQFVRRRKFTK